MADAHCLKCNETSSVYGAVTIVFRALLGLHLHFSLILILERLMNERLSSSLCPQCPGLDLWIQFYLGILHVSAPT